MNNMGLYDSIKAIVLDVINSLQTLKLDEIRSVGKQPLRMIHESGAELELRQDGKAYYNNTEIGSDSISISENLDMNGYNIIEADSIVADAAHDLTFTVDTGQAFVFSKV